MPIMAQDLLVTVLNIYLDMNVWMSLLVPFSSETQREKETWCYIKSPLIYSNRQLETWVWSLTQI